jgi:hypothetical protein
MEPTTVSSIIATVFRVGLQLVGLQGTLAKARQARKQQVADFLAALAQTIEDVSASLKQDIYPHGKCQELLSHSEHMESAIGDLIGKQQAADLGNQLKEVWEIELLYGELAHKTQTDRVRSLDELDRAAGLFRSTAAYVRVSPR